MPESHEEFRIQNPKLDEDFTFHPNLDHFISHGLYDADVLSEVVPFSVICASPEAHNMEEI